MKSNIISIYIAGELMGFQNSVKTYSNITLLDPDIVRGVNFASGAAGILPESGSALVML